MLYTETLSKVNALTSLLSNANLSFPLVVDQVAVVVRPELLDAAKAFYGAMGHTEWAMDSNKAVGTVFGQHSRVEGELHFSYSALNLKPGLDTKGLEFEILVYNPANLTPVEGLPYDNWHSHRARKENTSEPGMQLSHFGFHLPSEDALEEVKAVMLAAGFEIAQEVRTVEHSNPFLVETGRKYHYLIFHSRQVLGADLKFIARVQ